jgi:hypothetical protein
MSGMRIENFRCGQRLVVRGTRGYVVLFAGVAVACGATMGWAASPGAAAGPSGSGTPAAGSPAASQSALGPAESERGIAGAIEITYSGGTLRAKAGQDASSPVLVRVVKAQDAAKQRIEFLGLVAGTYDLREHLELADGRPAPGLPAMPVRVVSKLPPQAGTDVVGLSDSGFSISSYYRELAIAAGVVWLAIPVGVLVVRAMRRRAEPAPAPPPPPEPTVAEQLRAMLDLAKTRGLGIDERGRLELLLLRFSADHLARGEIARAAASSHPVPGGSAPAVMTPGLPANPLDEQAAAIRALREHPETRPLVLAVERWLHGPGAPAQAATDAAAMLEAFRVSKLDRQSHASAGGDQALAAVAAEKGAGA